MAEISKVDIINKALAHLGERPITSLSEGTTASDTADAIFDLLVRECLAEYPWKFARTRATLAPTGVTPPFEWDHEFLLPTDFIQIVKTYPEFPQTFAHHIEDGKLYTNLSNPQIKYVRYIAEPARYSSGFIAALALLIAFHIAPRVADNERKTQQLYELYLARLQTMRSLDGQQGTPDAVQHDEWLEARN